MIKIQSHVFMAKFRLLTIEELKELEKEFVEYLILVGIAADDWVKLKDEEPEKAENIVHLFSDVVFGKIMRKTQFLEQRKTEELKVLQCLKDRFVVIGLNASKIHASPSGAHETNLLDSEYLKKAMQIPPSNLEVYTTEIPYNLSREEDIFNLTKEGFSISDGKLFKTLCLVLPQ